MPGPSEGSEGGEGGRHQADDHVGHRHVADVHVGGGSQLRRPGHSEEDEHVANNAGRYDETIDQEEGQLRSVGMRR